VTRQNEQHSRKKGGHYCVGMASERLTFDLTMAIVQPVFCVAFIVISLNYPFLLITNGQKERHWREKTVRGGLSLRRAFSFEESPNLSTCFALHECLLVTRGGDFFHVFDRRDAERTILSHVFDEFSADIQADVYFLSSSIPQMRQIPFFFLIRRRTSASTGYGALTARNKQEEEWVGAATGRD